MTKEWLKYPQAILEFHEILREIEAETSPILTDFQIETAKASLMYQFHSGRSNATSVISGSLRAIFKGFSSMKEGSSLPLPLPLLFILTKCREGARKRFRQSNKTTHYGSVPQIFQTIFNTRQVCQYSSNIYIKIYYRRCSLVVTTNPSSTEELVKSFSSPPFNITPNVCEIKDLLIPV